MLVKTEKGWGKNSEGFDKESEVLSLKMKGWHRKRMVRGGKGKG